MGIDSPVNIDSSMLENPEIISPSTGTDIPGLTMKISSIRTSSMGIDISLLSRITIAVFGDKSSKALIEFVVFPLEYDSNVLPIVINVGTIPAVSKEIFIIVMLSISEETPFPVCTNNMTDITSEYINATELPNATSVSIFGDKWIIALKPLVKNL